MLQEIITNRLNLPLCDIFAESNISSRAFGNHFRLIILALQGCHHPALIQLFYSKIKAYRAVDADFASVIYYN